MLEALWPLLDLLQVPSRKFYPYHGQVNLAVWNSKHLLGSHTFHFYEVSPCPLLHSGMMVSNNYIDVKNISIGCQLNAGLCAEERVY
jgi:hypothetical protein